MEGLETYENLKKVSRFVRGCVSERQSLAEAFGKDREGKPYEGFSERCDNTMRGIYNRHGIENISRLAQQTGLSRQRLDKTHALTEPHRMSYGSFRQMCEALGEDIDEVLLAFFGITREDEEEDMRRRESLDAMCERLSCVVDAFLALDAGQQRNLVAIAQALPLMGQPDLAAAALIQDEVAEGLARCSTWSVEAGVKPTEEC